MNNISIVQVVDIFNALHIDSAMQICDDQLNFRFVGNKLLETVDCTTNSVLDKKLVDIKTPVQHLAKEYYRINAPILTEKVSEANYTTYYTQGCKLIIAKTQVKPIKTDAKVSGLFFNTTVNNNPLNFNFSILSDTLKNKNAVLVNDKKEAPTLFNEIEELIIFLMVIGKVDKEISQILESIGVYLSRAGVAKLVSRKLFPKLDVDTRNQLISRVFYCGLINRIPPIIAQNADLLNLSFSKSLFI